MLLLLFGTLALGVAGLRQQAVWLWPSLHSLTFRRSADAFARNFLTVMDGVLERAGWDAEEREHLALQFR
ncbi:MAG: hypothetical protein MUF16_19220, partial [Burkholderiaceae bacterium]|nr:hypothetical protein [Burkholderiaceae bacterium]